MSNNFDFDAHAHLSGEHDYDVQKAIDKALEKSEKGHFIVCIINGGEVLVLPEFSASIRDDIAEVVFDTEYGYNFDSK